MRVSFFDLFGCLLAAFHLCEVSYADADPEALTNVSESVIDSLLRPKRSEESYETSHIQHQTQGGSPEQTPILNEPSDNRQGSRYRYEEFAETEYRRPSYFPIPYYNTSSSTNAIPTPRTGQGTNTAQPHYIDPFTLGQLIRHHIAHQRRIQQLTSQNSDGHTPILEGVTRLTELRQTPYRHFPHNSSALSYEEKRRRWKAAMKRQQQSAKIPPRILPTVVPAGNGADEAEARYYVTYSPVNNIYQVSRRPPPTTIQMPAPTYSTLTDALPESTLDPSQYTPLPDDSQREEIVENTLVRPPTVITTMPTSTSTSTSTTTTSPQPPILLVVQKTDPLPNMSPHLQQHTEITMTAAAKPTLRVPLVKQILHLDDYDVAFGEEEEERSNEIDDNTPSAEVVEPTTTTTTTTTTTSTAPPILRTTSVYRPPTTPIDIQRQDIEEVLDNIDAEEETNNDDEEEGEDLFFWKPDYDPRRPSASVLTPPPTSRQQREDDPFQIVAHPSQSAE